MCNVSPSFEKYLLMQGISTLEKKSVSSVASEGLFGKISSLFREIDGERLQNTLIGAGAAFFFLLFAISQVKHMEMLVGPYGPNGTEFYAAAASTLSKFIFLSLMMVLFVVRKQPVKKAKGLVPRFMALLGTFMIGGVALLPENDPALMQSIFGLSLVCIGSVLCVYVIHFLGRSFSLMAEARELVTHGPYSIVRHPLYMVEEVVVLGVVIQFFSLPMLALFLVHIGVQIQRMKNEEKVLTEAFTDEYKSYMLRTPRLIPGVY